MKFILFLTLILFLSVTSCEKQCINAILRFGLVGFSDTEADTIILRRFTKNSSSNPPDTFLLKQIQFSRRNDTLDMTGIPIESQFESNYNYELFFPEAGKLFTISDIRENKETMTKGLFNCTKEACINTITGYTVNGQFSNSIIHSELIYLKK
jgi:hypothetical protein